MSGRIHVLKPRVPDVFPGSWAVGARPASMMSAPPVWATTEVPTLPEMDADEKTLQHAMNNLLPAPSSSFTSGFKGFFARDMWTNARLWKAGVRNFKARINWLLIYRRRLRGLLAWRSHS